MSGPLDILVLGDMTRRGQANTLREHLLAFRRYSRHRVSYLDPRSLDRSEHLNLDDFDVVVVHYSLVIIADSYVSPWLREQITQFGGTKIQFLQDEYRWVDEVCKAMVQLGIDVLFSIVPEREFDAVYGPRLPGVEIVPTLAGYVPEGLVRRQTPPLARRTVDVGYRGRVLPPWLGRLAYDKLAVGQRFLPHGLAAGLRCDIAWGEDDRLYGEAWNRFLGSCRSVLGSESGSSITDFDGSLERQCLEYAAAHPEAGWEEIHAAVLSAVEGNVPMNVVSPRTFETAALRAAMVNFPGEYGGVIQPHEHYIPLETDMSNVDEVIAAIRDDALVEGMTARAYRDLIASGRYSLRTFVTTFDAAVDRHAVSRSGSRGRARRSFALRRVQIERARAAQAVMGYEVRTWTNAIGRTVALTRLLAVDPALRKLAYAYASDRPTRDVVRPSRLAADLLRLGVLRRAQRGQPVTATPFVLRSDVDPERGVITFWGLPEADRGLSQPNLASALRTTVGGERLNEIVWNHEALAGYVMYMLTGRHFVGVAVGYHGRRAIHEFGGVRTLARRRPDVVTAALMPLVRKPRSRRIGPFAYALLRAVPEDTRRRALRSQRTRELMASPRLGLAVAFVTARSFLEPGMIPIELAWLTAGRSRPSFPTFARDIVRLSVIKRGHRGRIGTIGRVDAKLEGDDLRLATGTAPVEYLNPWPVSEAATPRRVIWDNSSIGREINVPVRLRRSFSLFAGDDGVAELTALSELVRRRPRAVMKALVRPPLLLRLRRSALGRGLAGMKPRAERPDLP